MSAVLQIGCHRPHVQLTAGNTKIIFTRIGKKWINGLEGIQVGIPTL